MRSTHACGTAGNVQVFKCSRASTTVHTAVHACTIQSHEAERQTLYASAQPACSRPGQSFSHLFSMLWAAPPSLLSPIMSVVISIGLFLLMPIH